MTPRWLVWAALAAAVVLPPRVVRIVVLLVLARAVVPTRVQVIQWLVSPRLVLLVVKHRRLTMLRADLAMRLHVGLLPDWYARRVLRSTLARMWCLLRVHTLYYADPADEANPWHVRVRAVCCRECHKRPLYVSTAGVQHVP